MWRICYGQVLSNLISLGLTAGLCAGAEADQSAGGIGCAAVQALFSAGWTISQPAVLSLHKPKRTVVIYRDESDLRKLEEIRFFAERWSVERTVQWTRKTFTICPTRRKRRAAGALKPSRS